MKGLKLKLRVSKKLLLIVGGLLALSGTSAAGYAFYKGGSVFSSEPDKPSLSGLACTTLETVKIRRNGQRWVRKYITVEPTDGVERIRTALRAAGLLVKAEKADLYQVVVLDPAGPTVRAQRRGPAIGAEVLFAPDPGIVPGMTTSFRARYSDGKPNMVGLFYGPQVDLTMPAIQSTITAMTDVTDCAAPVVATVEDEHGAKPEHGEKADHGDEAAPAHGEEAAHGTDAHGEEPAAEGEAPAHGDAAATDAHGNPVAAEGHETPAGHDAPDQEKAEQEKAGHETAGHGPNAPAEKEGFFSSITSMVLGKKTETASAEPTAEPSPGFLGSLKSMVFGAPAPAAPEAGHADATSHEAPAPAHAAATEHAGATDHAEPVPEPPAHAPETILSQPSAHSTEAGPASHEPAQDEAHAESAAPRALTGAAEYK